MGALDETGRSVPMKPAGFAVAGIVAIVGLIGIGVPHLLTERQTRQIRAEVQAEIYEEQEACATKHRLKQLAAAASLRRQLDDSIAQGDASDAFKEAQQAIFAGAIGGPGSVVDNLPLSCLVSREEQERRVIARRL